MKAIVTKFHGAGFSIGSRITAKAEGVKSLTIPYPHELSGEACHRKAAEALATRQGWLKPGVYLIGGGMPDSTGYAFTFSDAAPQAPSTGRQIHVHSTPESESMDALFTFSEGSTPICYSLPLESALEYLRSHLGAI